MSKEHINTGGKRSIRQPVVNERYALKRLISCFHGGNWIDARCPAKHMYSCLYGTYAYPHPESTWTDYAWPALSSVTPLNAIPHLEKHSKYSDLDPYGYIASLKIKSDVILRRTSIHSEPILRIIPYRCLEKSDKRKVSRCIEQHISFFYIQQKL